MSAFYIMIPASLIVAIGFLVAFIWSVRSGQYEDDYTPSVRILFDETPAKIEIKDKKDTELKNE
jgi:cbb3-type cytochrome oxidase maturation protein